LENQQIPPEGDVKLYLQATDVHCTND